MRPSICVFLGLAGLASPGLPAFAVETPDPPSAAFNTESGSARQAPISPEASSEALAEGAEGRSQESLFGVSSQETSKEAAEVVGSEAALPSSPRRKEAPPLPAILLAKQKLSPEEFAEALKEAFEEIARMEKSNTTTTTTTAPGFFKEVALGVRNGLTAPLRAAKQLFTHPSQLWNADVGSAVLASKKLDSALDGQEGGVKELARDWWRLFTMNPDRQKEAKKEYLRAMLEGHELGRMVFRSDEETAIKYGENLQKALEAEKERKRLKEEQIPEHELEKEFYRIMLKQD